MAAATCWTLKVAPRSDFRRVLRKSPSLNNNPALSNEPTFAMFYEVVVASDVFLVAYFVKKRHVVIRPSKWNASEYTFRLRLCDIAAISFPGGALLYILHA